MFCWARNSIQAKRQNAWVYVAIAAYSGGRLVIKRGNINSNWNDSDRNVVPGDASQFISSPFAKRLKTLFDHNVIACKKKCR